jgi:flagellar capping protein FliD
MAITPLNSSSYSGLDSTYINLINNIVELESQPLTAIEYKRDTISAQQDIYKKLNTYMTDFQSSVKALLTTDSAYDFKPDYTVKYSNKADTDTVITAKASSDAIAADYDIAVTTLAKSHQVASKKVTYINQALKYQGSFWLGGNGAAAAELASGIAGTVEGAGLANLKAGQSELGSGAYYVETRQDSKGGWQFRVVDSNGQAVKIAKHGTTDSYTSSWQSIPVGETFDTGRGLTLNFGSDPEAYVETDKDSGAAVVNYQSKGVLINVKQSHTLVDIAYAINHAGYAENEKIIATIVDNQLVLSRESTGAGNNVIAYENQGDVLTQLEILQGGVFKNVRQNATDAVFSVNGTQMTRSRNKDLTDVINGVTLSLASDAEGKSATLNVEYQQEGQKNKLETFIAAFNKLTTYLSENLTTKQESSGAYTRGALTGDSMFASFRLELLNAVTNAIDNGGEYKALRELGITMGNDLKLSISDSADLEEALSGNSSEVTKLLDGVMTRLSNKLSRFLGNKGYLSTTEKALDTQLGNANDRIEDLEERLTLRQQSLLLQYAQMQAQLEAMTSTAKILTSFYNA